jgi:hypothetical protein
MAMASTPKNNAAIRNDKTGVTCGNGNHKAAATDGGLHSPIPGFELDQKAQ